MFTDDHQIGGFGAGSTYVIYGRVSFNPTTAPVITSTSSASFAENGVGTAYTITATD